MSAAPAFGPSDDLGLPPREHWSGQLGRLGRLALKELRENLRDRRTIITLVLMPLLLYPLLMIASRQFFLAHTPDGERLPEYRIGFVSADEARLFCGFLQLHPADDPNPDADGRVFQSDRSGPLLRIYESLDTGIPAHAALPQLVASGYLDTAVMVKPVSLPTHDSPNENVAVDLRLVMREESPLSQAATDYLEELIQRANMRFLEQRLGALGVTQRPVPFDATVARLPAGEQSKSLSLVTLVPLILILMTMTGAVYPAIDLTAGERERGTLEILVAAPVPRMGLLLAKYVTVLTVACLTATMNLVMMTATVLVSGLGPQLLGGPGLTAGVVAGVFALLVLFASFFSALLLAVASFARSFKEAQAYLVPLMLVALAPGMVSLMPDLQLTPLLSIVPLVNTVLLARDLFQHTVDGPMAAMVVVSTLVYAVGAVSVAARIFGSEAVLYSDAGSLAQMFQPPKRPRAAALPSSGLLCLAVIFPLHFMLTNWIAANQGLSIGQRLLASALATALAFGIMPYMAARLSHVEIASGFRVRGAAWPLWFAASALGLSLWPILLQLQLLQTAFGIVHLSAERMASLANAAEQLRQMPLPLLLLAIAVVPAVFEEWFFRGYLMTSLMVRMRPRNAIVISAVFFGAFHLVSTGLLPIEKLLPSTIMGLVLGWLAWRSGSVLPGMLLHALHNGAVMTLGYFAPQLEKTGWIATTSVAGELDHVPITWLAVAALGVALGLGAVLRFGGPKPGVDEPTTATSVA